ncbi:hypothetical protein ACS0TY_012169 [Phlomoides rotata]
MLPVSRKGRLSGGDLVVAVRRSRWLVYNLRGANNLGQKNNSLKARPMYVLIASYVCVNLRIRRLYYSYKLKYISSEFLSNCSFHFQFNIRHYFMSMPKPESLVVWLLILTLGPQFRFSRADIGTASNYSPPYTPTACYGNDFSQFPSSNLFAAAGEGIWDNGAACGRQYLVRCISATVPLACKPGQTIQIRIVDRAETSVSRPSRPGSSLVLSNTAYQTIADPAVPYLNIEFQQL